MSQPNRRAFLQQSTSLGLGLGLYTVARGQTRSASDKIHVACIGVRGRGNSVMHSFADESDCVVTHLCDVSGEILERRGAEMRDKTGVMPKLVNDYRTLLDDASVDVFMVATPDHWHALPTIHGCLADKDVYVEKPASHNIREGRAAVAAARKHDRVVQVGTQIRSADFLREAREFVRSGALGQVIYGKAWETARNGEVRLAADSQAPKRFDYDLWQGPVAERPYNESIVGGAWRWLFDYGTGDLGNDGVHRIDYCRYVMGLDDPPQAISCSGGKFFFEDDQQWPDTMLINYEYPRHVLQYEMRLWSRPELFGAGEGAVIYGENGWLQLTNSWFKAYDADGKLMREARTDGGKIQRAHVRNFLDAVRDRTPATLNQDIVSGHISTVMCHAGNISWRTGKKLRFDATTEMFDDPGANQYVGREHRAGFELPEIA